MTLAAGTDTGTGEAVVFWVLAPIAVLASFGMLFSKKAVHSAVLLAVVDALARASSTSSQAAPFLGVVQVVVYTGAVMMLFLFVLMLVGVDSSDSLVETLRGPAGRGACGSVSARCSSSSRPARAGVQRSASPRRTATATSRASREADLHAATSSPSR